MKKKIQLKNCFIFFFIKIAIYLSKARASIQDFQATGEAFSPEMRTSRN
jgi:hypothetical protein